MSEIPEAVKILIETAYTDELIELKDVINRKTMFLAQGSKLKLYTINSDSNKVLMTFEAQYEDNPRFERIIWRHLDERIGKWALVVF